MYASPDYPMLKHVVNDKSGYGTDGSNGYAAMRPWIHHEARVIAQKREEPRARGNSSPPVSECNRALSSSETIAYQSAARTTSSLPTNRPMGADPLQLSDPSHSPATKANFALMSVWGSRDRNWALRSLVPEIRNCSFDRPLCRDERGHPGKWRGNVERSAVLHATDERARIARPGLFPRSSIRYCDLLDRK